MPEDKEAEPKRTPTHEIVADGIARAAFKIDDVKITEVKLNELASLLWRREGETQDEIHLRAVRALEHFNSLEPADGAEGMLAGQMVGTHFAALECLRRAALPNQTFEGRDMALRHASKLMALYTKQLETLNKHRGKGQQKVTVEHIHVEKGGQAIVGNVDASLNRQAAAKPPQLEHKPDEAVLPEIPEMKRVRQRTRK